MTAPEPRRIDWQTAFTASAPTGEGPDPDWHWEQIFPEHDREPGGVRMPRAYLPANQEHRARPRSTSWDGYAAAGTGDADDGAEYTAPFG